MKIQNKLILNFSNKITFISEKKLGVGKSNAKWILFSPFLGDEKEYPKIKYKKIPHGYIQATSFNNAIWEYNMLTKNSESFDEIIIINVKNELFNWIKDKKLKIIKNKKNNLIEVIKNWKHNCYGKQNCYRKHNCYIVIKENKTNDLKMLMLYSAISYYRKSIEHEYLDFLLGWLYEINKIFKDKTNFEIYKNDAYEFFKNEKKRLEKKREFLYWDNKNCINKMRPLNLGNEGKLYKKGERIIKTFPKNNKKILKKWKMFKIEKTKFNLAIDKMIKHNKNLNMRIQNLLENEDNDYMVAYDQKNYMVAYDDKIYPTEELNFADIAYSLKKQIRGKYFIDDNKIENFGKLDLEKGIYKIIYNDFGASFLDLKKDDEDKFDKIFDGIIRDNYYLVKEHKNRNSREIIKSMRNFDNIREIKSKKFEEFVKFVKSKDDKPKIYICHDDVKKEVLKNYDEVHICENNVSTLKKIRKTKNGKNFVYDLYANNEKILECKNNVFTLKKRYGDLIDWDNEANVEKEHKELGISLIWEVESVKLSIKKKNFKIIGLVTTSGKRNLTKSILSMEKQSLKLDSIYIAAEKKINSKYEIFVNPFKKGIARNTMQALLKLKLKYKNEKIYIATLDDDDEWALNYIEKAKKQIEQGYNFISGYLKYVKNNKDVDIWKFNNKLTYEDFLYGNPGIEGSNKIFDLDLALESGGMVKEINTATDRVFNINMLRHPNVNLGVINEVVAYHYTDSKGRVTDDKNKIQELRKFYKHFWHLIDKDKIKSINERHSNLHNLKEVINWK